MLTLPVIHKLGKCPTSDVVACSIQQNNSSPCIVNRGAFVIKASQLHCQVGQRLAFTYDMLATKVHSINLATPVLVAEVFNKIYNTRSDVVATIGLRSH